MFITARFARDAEFAERKDLQRDGSQENSCAHKNMLLDKGCVSPQGMLLFVFLCPESPAFFSGIKGKQ